VATAGDPTGARPDLRLLRDALRALALGDFTVRLGTSDDPLVAECFDAFDDVATLRSTLTDEIVRVSRTVGREGRMGERVHARRGARRVGR
jgi:hypothetical protein